MLAKFKLICKIRRDLMESKNERAMLSELIKANDSLKDTCTKRNRR